MQHPKLSKIPPCCQTTMSHNDEERPSQNEEDPPPSTDRVTKTVILSLIAIGALVWGSVMTALYINETRRNNHTEDFAQPLAVDTTMRTNGALGMAAISHINVVVNDTIDIGASYYELLGFAPATNKDGPMHYTNITNHGFCVDAGCDTCRVDIIFLKHEIINLYLELFYYYEPVGDTKIPIVQTNDAGGIRHIAVEVENSVETYNELKGKDHQGRFMTRDTPIPLDPFPYTFFYWVDKYGVQWEFEQGRPVEYYHIAGITG